MYRSTPGPAYVVSSRCSPAMPVDRLIEAASALAADGVEIDLTTRLAHRRRLDQTERWSSAELAPLVWVPAAPLANDLLDQRPAAIRAGLIVVDEPHRPDADRLRAQLRHAVELREATGTRTAIAIRPRNPEGGRGHLAKLGLLRRMAEEWDIDLALDLTGQVDWLWEAEAAVARLLPRLRVIRVAFPPSSFDSHVRGRLTNRAVASAAENEFDGVVSIVVRLSPWHWRNAAALYRGAGEAIERLSTRFALGAGYAPEPWRPAPPFGWGPREGSFRLRNAPWDDGDQP